MERIVVYADRVEGAGWHLRIARRADPADPTNETLLGQRDIGRVGDDFTGYFPQPPSGESTAEPLCAENDGAALEKALKDLKARPVPQKTAEEFGRYLFLTLLGDACWTEITRHLGPAPLELALCWKAGEQELSALPWELMRDSQGFLVAASTRPVAITRLIADARAIAPVMPSPLRVLFVIGSAPDDTRIRAGAEYLGLMRHLDAKELAGEWESAGLHPRLLARATSQQLQDEIARFAPSVVHFICHGGVINGGAIWSSRPRMAHSCRERLRLRR